VAILRSAKALQYLKLAGWLRGDDELNNGGLISCPSLRHLDLVLDWPIMRWLVQKFSMRSLRILELRPIGVVPTEDGGIFMHLPNLEDLSVGDVGIASNFNERTLKSLRKLKILRAPGNFSLRPITELLNKLSSSRGMLLCPRLEAIEVLFAREGFLGKFGADPVWKFVKARNEGCVGGKCSGIKRLSLVFDRKLERSFHESQKFLRAHPWHSYVEVVEHIYKPGDLDLLEPVTFFHS